VKKVGILGGTFNPIHLGHLAIAQVACEKLDLDEVVFVPSNQPPHKSAKNVVSAEHRYNMVKLAIEGNDKFSISDYEVKKKGKSYSIDTMEYFREKYSKRTKLFFIVGDDSVATLHSWKKIDELTKIVAFVAIKRLGFKSSNNKIKVKQFSMLNLGISSSHIRRAVSESRSIRYLVPDNVVEYINQNKLYR
jgi:nicotinate-nucleotide adenylyltransferase